MKIAVISDIHGNIEALDSVMEDIKNQECEKIFALGDYAMAGPEPSVTVNRFMEWAKRPDFILIQGNTDLMIANYTETLYYELREKVPVMAEALKDDSSKLNPLQKDFLRNLPVQLESEEDRVKILLVHGSPRKNNEDILPDTKMSEVEEMLVCVDADVVLCGHTHIPCGFQTSKKQSVVNAGSVGRPFTPEPKACWLKMTVKDGKYVFEHRFVEYNNERAAKIMRSRQFMGANILANALLDPKLRHF